MGFGLMDAQGDAGENVRGDDLDVGLGGYYIPNRE